MKYRYLRYSQKYLSSLTQLLDDAFHISNQQKQSLIQWKYFTRQKNHVVTYIAVDSHETVVSHYANIPIFVQGVGKPYKAMICTDMATSREHRGNGLITALSQKVYTDVIKQGYDFTIGFSNDDGIKVDTYSRGYNYQVVGKFVRYFKIVFTYKHIPYKLKKRKHWDISFHHQFHFLTIQKTQSYLSWRYSDKPYSEYEIYAAYEHNSIVGYVVLRFIGGKCYIYDIVTDNYEKKHMITILRSIENESLSRNVRIIIYNVLDNSYWSSLFNKYKYFKKTHNAVNYYLTIKFHHDHLSKDYFLNKENWLLMNGDIL